MTIDPTKNLNASTHYFVTFSAGVVRDMAGNLYAGTTTYDFTTAAPPDTTAPTVSSFSPAGLKLLTVGAVVSGGAAVVKS